MPYDQWAGFAYSELNWSPSDFWGATVWDVVAGMMFHNKKNKPSNDGIISRKEADKFATDMKIKGFA